MTNKIGFQKPNDAAMIYYRAECDRVCVRVCVCACVRVCVCACVVSHKLKVLSSSNSVASREREREREKTKQRGGDGDYLMSNGRQYESGPHCSILGEIESLQAFKKDVSVKEVVNDAVPLTVVLSPTRGVPPISVEL